MELIDFIGAFGLVIVVVLLFIPWGKKETKPTNEEDSRDGPGP